MVYKYSLGLIGQVTVLLLAAHLVRQPRVRVVDAHAAPQIRLRVLDALQLVGAQLQYPFAFLAQPQLRGDHGHARPRVPQR